MRDADPPQGADGGPPDRVVLAYTEAGILKTARYRAARAEPRGSLPGRFADESLVEHELFSVYRPDFEHAVRFFGTDIRRSAACDGSHVQGRLMVDPP